MKSLSAFENKLVSSGKVALDTNIFIYLLEKNDEYFTEVQGIFQLVEERKISCLTSLVSVLEVLSSPKLIDSPNIEIYKKFFLRQEGLTVYDFNWEIVEKAAQFRRQFGITSPDAVQLATAETYQAKLFITNDRVFRKFDKAEIKTEIYFLP